jgi:hypothetical protein
MSGFVGLRLLRNLRLELRESNGHALDLPQINADLAAGLVAHIDENRVKQCSTTKGFLLWRILMISSYRIRIPCKAKKSALTEVDFSEMKQAVYFLLDRMK